MTIPTISLQAYSVGAQLEADAAETLRRLAGYGYRNLEPILQSASSELLAILDDLGFGLPTAHASYLFESIHLPDGTTMTIPDAAETFSAAAAAGVGCVIDPYVAPSEWQTHDGIRSIARRFNDRAAEAQGHGLIAGYHNHGHEIATKVDGRHALEVLADHLDDGVVLELDLFWAAVGGADVPALVDALGARVIAVHVKDGILGTDDPVAHQTPAGQGDVPLAEALDAARHLRYAVVEFDLGYPGDVMQAAGESYRFLADRGLG